MTDVTNALKALRPNSSFGVIGDRIKWNDPDNTKPTKKEINNKIDQLKAEADLVLYKDQRLKEIGYSENFDIEIVNSTLRDKRRIPFYSRLHSCASLWR